jgi:RNA polymerase sigma-70 factor (ECF subfamily)
MDQTTQFVGLLTRHQPSIYVFIRRLVPNSADADDIFQDMSKVLWEKFDQFEPGTAFDEWAKQIARFEVLHFHRRNRTSPIRFSDELVNALADDSSEEDSTAECRDALQQCLAKLRPADRALLAERYEPGETIKHLAEESNRPVQTLYSKLKRIRQALFECIQRTLSADGESS